MLRLKNNNVDSISNENGESCATSERHKQNALNQNLQEKDTSEKTDMNNSPSDDLEDDSILHFKSPKMIPNLFARTTKPIAAAKKLKLKSGNENIKSSKQKSKNSGQVQSKKKSSDRVQPCIESSFFEPRNNVKSMEVQANVKSMEAQANVKSGHMCPLCLKVLKDENSKVIHMKSCAIKHNISTKKLLDAVYLQERQAAERQSLGLITAPVLQDKKKSIPRRFNVQDESDLQYALALSKSLHENEEAMELEEVELIANICGSSQTIQDYRGTLSKFGFTSSKPIIEDTTTNRSRKRKILKETVLQTRTKEERDTLMGERVAEILMGNDAVTQKLNEESQDLQKKEKPIVLTSRFLKELVQSENKLWDKTSLTKNQDDFYVKTLSPKIFADTKNKSGTKFDIVMEYFDENGQYHPLDEVSIDHQNQNVDVSLQKYCDSPVNQKNQCNKMEMEQENKLDMEKNFVNTLVTDWRNTLNDSSMSDIMVILNDNRHIWTHKLVLYVRCPNLLLDVESKSNSISPIKEIISWPDTDYSVALAFLEFIYCGTIEKYSDVLNDEEKLVDLRRLARRYKVKNVFAYLRNKRVTVTSEKVERNVNECIEREESCNERQIVNTSETSNKPQIIEASNKNLLEITVNEITAFEGNNLCTNENNTESIVEFHGKDTYTIDLSKNREYSLSPDIFDDTQNATLNFSENCSSVYKARYGTKGDIDSDKITSNSINKEEKCSENLEEFTCTINRFANNKIVAESTLDIDTNSFEKEEIMADNTLDMDTNPFEKEEVLAEDTLDTDTNSPEIKSQTKTNVSPIIETPITINKSTKSHRGTPTMPKQKSNLSLFIEEMKRANAKDDLNIDSLLDSPLEVCKKRHRNPFKVNLDDSDDPIRIDASQKNVHSRLIHSANDLDEDFEIDETDEELCNLSAIEHIENEHFKNINRTFDDPFETKKNDKSLSLNNEEDIKKSIQKYITSPDTEFNNDIEEGEKKQREDTYVTKDTNRRNSIEKEIECPLSSEIVDERDDEKRRNKSYEDLSVDNIEKDSTFEAEEESLLNDEDVSMYTRYKRKNKNNSIQKYRSACLNRTNSDPDYRKDVFDDEIRTENEDCNEANKNIEVSKTVIHDAHVEIIVLSDTESVESVSESKASSCKSFKNTSNTASYDKCEDKLTENNQSFRALINTGNELTVDESFQCSLSQRFTRINSPELNNSCFYNREKEKDLDEANENNGKTSDVDCPGNSNSHKSFNIPENEYMYNLSPLSIHMSPEYLFEFDRDTRYAEKLTQKSFDNVEKDKDKNWDWEAEEKHTDKCTYINNSKKNISSSPATDLRRFKRKSLSEGNFNISTSNDKCLNNKSIRESQRSFCKNKESSIIETEPIIIEKDVTPSPDYNTMLSPELHHELKKYGLKSQKRSRAVKLLTYIYNESHPKVLASSTNMHEIIDSDEEDTPRKRRKFVHDDSKENERNNNGDNVLPSCSRNNHANIEQMELNKNCLKKSKKKIDIKEELRNLIKENRELYNKILRYEPVDAKELQGICRGKGIICSMNKLMDFVDEQCITVRVPNKNNDRNRAKSRPKASTSKF